MSRSALAPYPLPAQDLAPIYDALGDAMATAATYAETAIRFAEVRDGRGCAYAVRCCAAAVMSAAALVEEVRPSRQAERDAA